MTYTDQSELLRLREENANLKADGKPHPMGSYENGSGHGFGRTYVMCRMEELKV